MALLVTLGVIFDDLALQLLLPEEAISACGLRVSRARCGAKLPRSMWMRQLFLVDYGGQKISSLESATVVLARARPRSFPESSRLVRRPPCDGPASIALPSLRT